MRELKIGFLQQHNVADIKNNIERLAEGITDLAQRGAELVILQELHNSLYFCQTEDVNKFDLAETIPGPSTGFYGELARELGIVIVTSLFEKRAPGLYHNTAVVIEKDGSIAGHEPDPSEQTQGIQFWGSSFAAGPQGELLYRACDNDEESVILNIDLDHSENVRRWWPFLRDRRIDEYGEITKRFID